MPKVSINIIKDWFKNQSKPPQEQFWAWLDSFWHKDDPIPQSAVENLVPNLQKKADLVDGVVPESQLPFSVVTSEVIALGSVTVDGDKVNLLVHSSGANTVRVKGRTITRTFPNQWTFTPIQNNGVKVLRGYAVKTENDFFLAEGPELSEYEKPEIPPDALELFEFEVTANGVTLVQEDLTAYKLKANDAWVRVWVNYTTNVQTISIHHAALRFIVRAGHDSVKIGGFNFYKTEFLYDGVEINLRNETLGELELATVAASGNTIPINPADLPINLKIGESCTLAYDAYANVFNVQKMGSEPDLSGYATIADLDTEEVNRAMADAAIQSQVTSNTMTRSSVTDKMVHYWDQSVMRWISTGVEFLGTAILKLKIIAFGGYTIAQKNAIVSPVEGMLIYQNETPKGFQKYENGAWSELGGSNISTADLSNVSARTFTQGNTFTWNTAGHFHYLKGLLDKTGNGAYTKALIIHPTTGERVTRDFADPAATALAIQNANSTQKANMRTALLGTATPPSPIINVVNTYYIKRNTFTMLILSGVNLVPLDPTSIWIQSGSYRVDATSYFSLSSVGLQTFWNIPSDFPTGEYLVNLSFGAVSQGANIGKLVVIDETTPLNYDFDNSNLIIQPRSGYSIVANTTYLSSTNNFRLNKNSTTYSFGASDGTYDVVAKTSNVFLGGLNSSWEIIISFTAVDSAGNGANTAPFLILTETNDNDFISAESIFSNYGLVFTGGAAVNISLRNSSGGSGGVNIPQQTGVASTIVVRKAGNVLTTYLFDIVTGNVTGFVSTNIDTTKNYALAFIGARNSNGVRTKDIKLTTSIYNP